jgi:hypothetical protein
MAFHVFRVGNTGNQVYKGKYLKFEWCFPGKGFAGCRIILDTIPETTRSSVIPVSALVFHVFRVGNTGNQGLHSQISQSLVGFLCGKTGFT